MQNRLNVLSQVMLSLNDDQNNVMNDINALLNNGSKEVGLIDKLKKSIRKLSQIHSDMEEVQFFIVQTNKTNEDMHKKNPKGPFNKKEK